MIAAAGLMLQSCGGPKDSTETADSLNAVKDTTTTGATGIAVVADGLFIETHPDPAHAKSDGANMLRLDLLEPLLQQLVRIRQVI